MQIESVILDIVKTELALADDHCWIVTQNRIVPDTTGMFLTVQQLSAQPITSISSFHEADESEDYPYTKQVVVLNSKIQINVFSRDNTALTRNWEVIAALRSNYAVEQQQNLQFRLYQISQPMVNVSELNQYSASTTFSPTGGSRIYQFSVTCVAQYAKDKNTTVSYYDSFGVTAGNEENLEAIHWDDYPVPVVDDEEDPLSEPTP